MTTKKHHTERWLQTTYWDIGLTLNQMAEIANVSRETVRRHMDKQNIPRRTNGKDGKKEKPFADEELLRELYHEKRESTSEIAERFDCDRRTIARWLDRFEIERIDRNHRPSKAVPIKTNDLHYEVCWDREDRNNRFMHHRLIAVAEYGFDAVKGKDVHHKNGFRWDNRPSNLELLTRSEHTKLHHEQGDLRENERPSQAEECAHITKVKRKERQATDDENQTELGGSD